MFFTSSQNDKVTKQRFLQKLEQAQEEGKHHVRVIIHPRCNFQLHLKELSDG